MSVTPGEVMDTLARLARELDDLSGALHITEREREPVERAYEAYLTDFDVALWKRHEDGDLARLPSEAMRVRLAHKEMDPTLLGSYVGLQKGRKRAEKRIAAIKAEVDAWRSVLSALKTEIEATR